MDTNVTKCPRLFRFASGPLSTISHSSSIPEIISARCVIQFVASHAVSLAVHMKIIRGRCNKRNEQGQLSCGCNLFLGGGRGGQPQWCDSCEHHANMHDDALPAVGNQVDIYFLFPSLTIGSTSKSVFTTFRDYYKL